jgi:multidrug resistance efflux pump
MIKGEKLRDSLLTGKELMKEYAELSEMMKKLGETGDEALKREIEKKLAEIENLMSELARKMSAMSGDIQEGFLNRDAFKSIDMQSKLDEIAKLMKDGNIEKAMQMMAGLEQSLQSMMASLESGMQSFGMSSFSRDMSKLNEMLARLEGLEKEETELRERTQGLKDSLLKEQGAGSDSVRNFIDQEKKKVEEIIKNLSQAKSRVTRNGANESSPEGTYLLDSLVQKAEELKNWLDSMEMKEAHKNARNVEETSKGLRDLGEAGVGNLKAAREEIGNSERLAGEVARDLERFMGSDYEAPESSGMAKRQDEIREETGGLSDEIEDLRKEMLLSPDIGEDLSNAESHMGRASDNLNGNELSKAISNEDEAVKSLKAAREKAESLLQKMQASAQGKGPPVPMVLGRQQMRQGTQGVDTEYVEIPEAAETEIGKEFKEKILEAMKGGSPEGYSELNKKYYDRIIK